MKKLFSIIFQLSLIILKTLFLATSKGKGMGSCADSTAAKLLDDSNKLSQHVIAGRSIFIEFDYKNTSLRN